VVAAPRLLPSPVAPAASPHPRLSPGATGAAVEELQRRLNDWIANSRPTGVAQLAVDGIFGPRTAATVRTFQQMNGLAVDGIVGPETWQRLLTLTNP
jgi:peptidoglycan hydrolase-like protein with peptidoglycan-binding domain